MSRRWWQPASTTWLETWVADPDNADADEFDDVLDELNGRRAQADANRGATNGLPPYY